MTEHHLFDEAKLAEIIDLMGGELGTLVDAFRTSGQDQVSRMREAGKSLDADGLTQAVHQLKGSSGNLGAAALQTRCEDLERTVRGGDIAGACDAIQQISDLYVETLSRLNRLTAGGSG